MCDGQETSFGPFCEPHRPRFPGPSRGPPKVAMARKLEVPVSVAVSCRTGKQCSRVVSLAAALGVGIDEAGRLHERARSGDEAARETIRRLRRAARAEDDVLD